MLVIAIPDTLDVRQMVETARTLNPDIEVAVRSHSEDDAALLAREGTARVFLSEEELAKGMISHVATTLCTLRISVGNNLCWDRP